MGVRSTVAYLVLLGGVAACGTIETRALATGGPTAMQCPAPDPGAATSIVRVGIVSDTHGSPAYLARAIDHMTCWAPHVLAHCGDIVFERPDYAAAVEPILSAFGMPGVPRAMAIGNHDVNNAALTLEAIRAALPDDATSWLEPGVMWGFRDIGGVRFIVLDATYQSKEPATRTGLDTGTNNVGGYIPQVELEWLTATIDAASSPCVIFMHQPLWIESGVGMISNAPAVRAALEARREKIAAVVNGHNHRPQSGVVNGINYFTANAMISPFEVITTHDRGLHQQLEVDTARRSVRFSWWEEDSVMGDLEARVVTAPY